MILIFLALSFVLLLKTFPGILYRANFTITGRGLLFEFLFFPIPCVLSKSANHASSFSSSLNNFKIHHLYFRSFLRLISELKCSFSWSTVLAFRFFSQDPHFHTNNLQFTLKSRNYCILFRSIFLILIKFLGCKFNSLC